MLSVNNVNSNSNPSFSSVKFSLKGKGSPQKLEEVAQRLRGLTEYIKDGKPEDFLVPFDGEIKHFVVGKSLFGRYSVYSTAKDNAEIAKRIECNALFDPRKNGVYISDFVSDNAAKIAIERYNRYIARTASKTS